MCMYMFNAKGFPKMSWGPGGEHGDGTCLGGSLSWDWGVSTPVESVECLKISS